MQGGGGASLVAADGSGEDVGAEDGAGGSFGCSVGGAEAAVDADVAGDSDEDGGDSAGGGAPPPHAPANGALAITGASRHVSEAQDDQERIRLMRVRIPVKRRPGTFPVPRRGSLTGAAPRLALITLVELAGVVVRDALAELRIPVVRADAQHGLDARGTSWRGSVLVRGAAAKKWIPSIAEHAQDVVDAAPVAGRLVARGDSRGRCASRRGVRCAAGQESEAEEGVSRPLFRKNGCAHGRADDAGCAPARGWCARACATDRMPASPRLWLLHRPCPLPASSGPLFAISLVGVIERLRATVRRCEPVSSRR
jgi:hypothetical protein